MVENVVSQRYVGVSLIETGLLSQLGFASVRQKTSPNAGFFMVINFHGIESVKKSPKNDEQTYYMERMGLFDPTRHQKPTLHKKHPNVGAKSRQQKEILKVLGKNKNIFSQMVV